MINARIRSVIQAPVALAALLVFSISALGADQRLDVIAPYRYLSPLKKPVDPVEQQGAYSYRNELRAEQRRIELSPSKLPGSSEARRTEEINRDISRIE